MVFGHVSDSAQPLLCWPQVGTQVMHALPTYWRPSPGGRGRRRATRRPWCSGLVWEAIQGSPLYPRPSCYLKAWEGSTCGLGLTGVRRKGTEGGSKVGLGRGVNQFGSRQSPAWLSRTLGEAPGQGLKRIAVLGVGGLVSRLPWGGYRLSRGIPGFLGRGSRL